MGQVNLPENIIWTHEIIRVPQLYFPACHKPQTDIQKKAYNKIEEFQSMMKGALANFFDDFSWLSDQVLADDVFNKRNIGVTWDVICETGNTGYSYAHPKFNDPDIMEQMCAHPAFQAWVNPITGRPWKETLFPNTRKPGAGPRLDDFVPPSGGSFNPSDFTL